MRNAFFFILIVASTIAHSQTNGKGELNNAVAPRMAPAMNSKEIVPENTRLDSTFQDSKALKSIDNSPSFSKKKADKSNSIVVSQEFVNQKRSVFSAAKLAATSQSKQRNPTQQQQEIMDQQVKELGEIAPISFDYNLMYYSSGNYDVSRESALKKAEFLSPNHHEVIKFNAANSIVKGDTNSAKKYLKMVEIQKIIPFESIDYTLDLLLSAPNNSTIVTHGFNDSYGAYINQLNGLQNQNKTVISLDFLQSDSYRKLLQNKGYKLPSEQVVGVSFLRDFCELNTDKNLYLSLTIPKEYFEPIKDKIFIAGLVFEYAPNNHKSTSYLWLDELWFSKMNKKVLTNYKTTLSHSFGLNYLPMLIYLQEKLKNDSDQSKFNQVSKEIITIKKNAGLTEIPSKKSE